MLWCALLGIVCQDIYMAQQLDSYAAAARKK